MVKKKNGKRKQTKRDRLLFDTSIQIDKFVRGSTDDQLRALSVTRGCFSSYFVLYEFKTGLVRNLIDFYLKVKIYDTPAEAIASWSRGFKIRELKSKILLESLIAKLFDSIQTSDKDRYLAQIEAAIFHLLSNFDTGVKAMVGEFGSDEMVKFKILNRSDYKPFIETYENRKCIPLDRFWKQNSTELKKLLLNKPVYTITKSLEKIYTRLMEVEKNVNNSNKYSINKGLGDAVIAVDCPTSFILTTLDTSFEVLCPALGKKHLVLK